MIRRSALVLCLLVGCLLAPKTASADVIGLTTPIAGTATVGDVYTLTVSFDPNGSLATNIVTMDLYLALAGLTPIGGSYQLGSLFAGYGDDAMTALDGNCVDMACGLAADYEAFAAVYAPFELTGAGVLFSMQLAAASTGFTLDLLGDSLLSLFWDPPGDDLFMEAVPFMVATTGVDVPLGTARINVSLTGPPTDPTDPTDPTPVPEPGSIALFATGLAGAAMRWRRSTSLTAGRSTSK
jgi:PEP-CTERM motif-containing protein